MELIVLNRQIKSKKKEMYHKAKQFGLMIRRRFNAARNLICCLINIRN